MQLILGFLFVFQLQILQNKSLKNLSDSLYLAHLINYEGLEAGSEGNFKDATEKFYYALKLLPKFHEAQLNLQIISDYENEIINYTQTKQLLYSALQLNRHKYADAESILEELVKELPKYYPLFIIQGKTYLRLKKYILGAKVLTQASIDQPINPYIFYCRAQLNHANSNLFGAIEDFSTAIFLDSVYADAYWGRGLVWRDLNDLDQSIMDFETALSLNPLYANFLEESLQIFESYNNRGIQFLKAGKYHQSISDFNRALEFNTQFSEPLINLGTAYRNLHEYDKALSCYMKAARIDSVNPNVFLNRGIFYKETKQFDLAIEDFQKVISLNSDNSDAYYNLGEIHFAKNNYENAIYYFKKAINANENHVWSHYWLALSYDNIKKWDKAINSYQNFIDYAPEIYYEHRLKAAERLRRLKKWLIKHKFNKQ